MENSGELSLRKDQFVQRELAQLQKSYENALDKVRDALVQLDRCVEGCDDKTSIKELSTTFEAPQGIVVPPMLMYGRFLIRDIKGEPLGSLNAPLLLPTKVNAVMFDMGESAEKIPNLFQNIIMRLLLGVQMNMVKFSIVDMDFGASFPFISTISNPLFKHKLSFKQEDVTKLISDLSEEIGLANRDFLGRYANADAYHLQTGATDHPYHFVFIDDFPNGFTPQTIDDLLRLIDNGNAEKAGIKVFINYSRKNPVPHDFDLSRFEKACACISQKTGSVVFENWPYDFPKNVVAQLETELSPNAHAVTDFINGVKTKEVSYSLDGWIEKLKNNNKVWSGTTVEGIKVPIGYISQNKMFEFYMANDNDSLCNDFFALIAGRPGYGKTVFLHNIIVNAAMKYSPDELCLYLADFAEGASFSIYRELPHVKSLMLANNKEYALRMLEDLELEQKKRSHLFQKAQRQYGKQVTNLSSYRETTGEPLPRILFVMDEFHYLFLSTDTTTLKAKETLCNGIRQWRKFGISIVLCTQSINGVNFGNADTQITYRFALNLLEMDSKSVIRNDAAKTLTRKGQTIMNNTADGNVNANVEFQSAFSPHYYDHVKYLADLYQQKYGKKNVPFICEAGTDVDIADSEMLTSIFSSANHEPNYQYCDVFVGKPDLLRETHTRIRYRRQLHSNTLILGDDFRTMIYDLAVQMVQLRWQSHPGSKFFLVDCFNVGDPFQGSMDKFNALDGVEVGNSQNVTKYLDDLCVELERRKEEQKEGKMTEARLVLAIMNVQNCYELRPTIGKYGTNEQSPAAKKLVTLLSEGAPFGIHCIVHGLSYETTFKTGILESRQLSLFENMVLLKGTDVGNMLLGGLKISSPDEVGQMIVINAKMDGEPYEQCSAYSDITVKGTNPSVELLVDLFENEKYRYSK